MRKFLLLLFVIACAVGAGVIYTLTNDAVKPTPAVTENKSQRTASSKPITLSLPGTEAIPTLKENYSSPSSLWVVVSKNHPLSEERYVPSNLVVPNFKTRTDKSTAEQSLRSDIAPAAKELFDAAAAAGHDVMLASGYRSYELQQTYFSNYAKIYGEEAANKFSARPGQSEHQTGLAFDISLSSRQCYLEVCFGETEAGKWLAAHAYEYGFVLRYPADKTEVTQYQYEPWHFRYVGRNLARALHESGLTLDEAYPYLQTALAELKARGLVK